MPDRVVNVEGEDLALIVGCLWASKTVATAHVAQVPAHHAEARAGAEATRDRIDGLARVLERAKRVSVVVPETGGEG